MKIINDITKIFLIYICTYILILKLINCKSDRLKNTIVAITSLLCAMIYVFLRQYTDLLLTLIIIGLLFGILIAKIMNFKCLYSIIITFISEALVFLVYAISIILSCIILKILIPTIEFENTIVLFVAITIELLIIYFSFKIKRFKNGFSFLKHQEKINNIGIIGIILVSIAILIYSVIGTYNNYILVLCLLLVVVVELIFIIVWIRRKITSFYKNKLKEQTVEDLTNEIKEKD